MTPPPLPPLPTERKLAGSPSSFPSQSIEICGSVTFWMSASEVMKELNPGG